MRKCPRAARFEEASVLLGRLATARREAAVSIHQGVSGGRDGTGGRRGALLLEALVELVEDAAAVEGQRDGPAGGALGIRLDPVGAELQRPFAVLLPLELGLAVLWSDERGEWSGSAGCEARPCGAGVGGVGGSWRPRGTGKLFGPERRPSRASDFSSASGMPVSSAAPADRAGVTDGRRRRLSPLAPEAKTLTGRRRI